MSVLDLLYPEDKEDVCAKEGSDSFMWVTVWLKLLELHILLKEELQWPLKIALQTLPSLCIGPVVALTLHAVRD